MAPRLVATRCSSSASCAQRRIHIHSSVWIGFRCMVCHLVAAKRHPATTLHVPLQLPHIVWLFWSKMLRLPSYDAAKPPQNPRRLCVTGPTAADPKLGPLWAGCEPKRSGGLWVVCRSFRVGGCLVRKGGCLRVGRLEGTIYWFTLYGPYQRTIEGIWTTTPVQSF